MYRGETEDECYLCGDGGDLVCCDYCSKVVHMKCWEEIGGFSQRDLDGVLNEDVLLCDSCCIGIADNMVMRRLGGEVVSKDGCTAKQWRMEVKKWANETMVYDAYTEEQLKKEKKKKKKEREKGKEEALEEMEMVSTGKPKPKKRGSDYDDHGLNPDLFAADSDDDDKVAYTPANKKKKATPKTVAPRSGSGSGSISTATVIKRMSDSQRERVVEEVCLGFYDPVLSSNLNLPICPTGGTGGLMCCKKCSDDYVETLGESDSGIKGQRERVEFVKKWLAKEEELLEKLEAEKIDGADGGGEDNDDPVIRPFVID